MNSASLDHTASVPYRPNHEPVEAGLLRAARKLGWLGAASVVPSYPACDLGGYSVRRYDVLGPAPAHTLLGGLMLEVMDSPLRYACRMSRPGAAVIVLTQGGYEAYETIADYQAARLVS